MEIERGFKGTGDAARQSAACPVLAEDEAFVPSAHTPVTPALRNCLQTTSLTHTCSNPHVHIISFLREGWDLEVDTSGISQPRAFLPQKREGCRHFASVKSSTWCYPLHCGESRNESFLLMEPQGKPDALVMKPSSCFTNVSLWGIEIPRREPRLALNLYKAGWLIRTSVR